MSSVLLLKLAGPLQAWGATARFARRSTEVAPTRSGVIGLLAAAQGRPRDADIFDLAGLRFAVRVDQPGSRLRDFHTAHHVDTGKAMPVSERFYLADAVFVAAVEGPADFVDRLYEAVRQPVFLPYLGRRSCPPAEPIDLGVVRGTDALGALRDRQWEAAAWYQRRHGRDATVELNVLTEPTTGEPADGALRDEPLSFDPRHRRYALRDYVWTTVTLPAAGPDAPPEHDPVAGLEEI